MNLSSKVALWGSTLSLVASVWTGSVAFGAGEPARQPFMFRPPMMERQGRTFEVPKWIREGTSASERLGRMSKVVSEFKVQDLEMVNIFKIHTELKFDKADATKFADDFKAATKKVEDILARRSSSMSEAEAKALETEAISALRAREELYDNFLKRNSKTAEHSFRPGEMNGLGEWGGALVMARGAEGQARQSGGTAPGATNEVHTESAVGSRGGRGGSTASTVPDQTSELKSKWTRLSPKLSDLIQTANTAAGLKGPEAKAVADATIATINKSLKAWESNPEVGTKFVNKLQEVVEALNGMTDRASAGDRKLLQQILGEMLGSRGITAESLNELGELIPKKGEKTPDVEALQGMHRMAMMLRSLREHFAKENKMPDPVKEKEKYEEWLLRRDEFVGDRLQKWVEYGEEFRSSVTGSANKAGFEKWMAGTHDHEKKPESERYPDKELGQGFCSGGCAGWMRKKCAVLTGQAA
jgi:hypothetical protein